MRPSKFFSHLIERSSDLIQHLPGAANTDIQAIRTAALTRFRNIGLPTLRDEAWRYTNIQPLGRMEFEPLQRTEANITAEEIRHLNIGAEDAVRVVFLDGWLVAHLSDLAHPENGVEVVSLAQFLSGERNVESEVYEFVTERLRDRANQGSDGFITLNSALAADGIVIHLKPGVHVERTLEILSISSSDAGRRMNNLNHFVFAESGSKLNVLEHYASVADSDHLTNSSITFRIGSDAVVDHYRIQNESDRAFHIGSSKINQDNNSKYRIYSLSFGALLDRHEVNESLDGEKSHCELRGLYLGCGKQHVDNYTTVVHASPNCTSDEYYKGILDDSSRSVFHGRIRVDIDSQHTDAQQQNKNLLLSRNAEADTKPQLEIYADDVKCSHGATVGQLDENAVFYLRTRGLSEKQARAVLTRAFATEIVQEIEIEALREQVDDLVQYKLGFNVEGRKVA